MKPPCEESKTGKKCKQGAHILCSCPREEKLPKLELLFIYKQRQKTGEIGGMQIGRPDFPESARQATYLVRKQAEEQGRQARAEKAAAEAQDNLRMRVQDEDFSKEVNDEADIVTETIEKSEHLKKRNTIDITSLASTALRYEVSSRAAAACATAYLGCLFRAGHLPSEAAYLAVDPSKIQRARDQVLSEATFSGLEQLEEQTPECLLFDSRIDDTMMRKHRGSMQG